MAKIGHVWFVVFAMRKRDKSLWRKYTVWGIPKQETLELRIHCEQNESESLR